MANHKMTIVEAFIPELSSVRASQSAKAEATSIPVAVKRALEEILSRDGVKHKRISTLRLTISILPVEDSIEEDDTACCRCCLDCFRGHVIT